VAGTQKSYGSVEGQKQNLLRPDFKKRSEELVSIYWFMEVLILCVAAFNCGVVCFFTGCRALFWKGEIVYHSLSLNTDLHQLNPNPPNRLSGLLQKNPSPRFLKNRNKGFN